MALDLTALQAQVHGLYWNLPAGAQSARKPVVILLHGLGGDRNDWMSPFQERNWPYDHHRDPDERDEGIHSRPPIAKLPGMQTRYFLSPKLQSNTAGAEPRLMRVYLWVFTPGSMIPRKSASGKLRFHWRSKPIEAKGASPIPDGIPLKVPGLDVDEIMPGRGDGLTADKRCHFPPSFNAEEHISMALSHAEELWEPPLQAEIIKRLDTFQ
jgi:hypothetical protein